MRSALYLTSAIAVLITCIACTTGTSDARSVAGTVTTEPILSAAVSQKKLKIVGGIYNLLTGKVDLVSS